MKRKHFIIALLFAVIFSNCLLAQQDNETDSEIENKQNKKMVLSILDTEFVNPKNVIINNTALLSINEILTGAFANKALIGVNIVAESDLRRIRASNLNVAEDFQLVTKINVLDNASKDAQAAIYFTTRIINVKTGYTVASIPSLYIEIIDYEDLFKKIVEIARIIMAEFMGTDEYTEYEKNSTNN